METGLAFFSDLVSFAGVTFLSDSFLSVVFVSGFFLELSLKSVSYQPVPFNLNAAADTSFRNAGSSHSGQPLKGHRSSSGASPADDRIFHIGIRRLAFSILKSLAGQT